MTTTGIVTKVTVVDEETRINHYNLRGDDTDASTAWMAMVQLAERNERDVIVKITPRQIVLASMGSLIILTGEFQVKGNRRGN